MAPKTTANTNRSTFPYVYLFVISVQNYGYGIGCTRICVVDAFGIDCIVVKKRLEVYFTTPFLVLLLYEGLEIIF